MSLSSHEHEAGSVIDRHVHDDHQLVYVSRGMLAVTTDLGAWVATADRAVWLPAHTWHEHRVYGSSSVHTVRFATDDAPLPGTGPTVLAVDRLLGELLVAGTDMTLPAVERHRIHAVMRDRLRRAHVQPLVLPSAQDPRLARACELVLADLSRTRSIAWLGGQAGAASRTLARLFRTEFGITYPQWRTNARVFQAMINLAAGASVTDTAHRCGWATPSAFVTTFARTMGQTPGTYRSGVRRQTPDHDCLDQQQDHRVALLDGECGRARRHSPSGRP